MAKKLPAPEVVLRPVEPGSDLQVGYEYVVSDLQFPDSPIVAICGTGWAERTAGAKRFANLVAGTLGCTAYGVVPPYAETVKKSSNPRLALRDMAIRGMLDVAEQLAQGRTVVFFGNSLAGPLVLPAAAESGSVVGTVSSAGFHNRLLGDTEWERIKNLGRSLLVVTTKQHVRAKDWAIRHAVSGGRQDMLTMKSRAADGTSFVVSDELQQITVESANEVASRNGGVVAAASEDACFWADGFAQVLGEAVASKLFMVVPGPHACLQGKFFEAQITPVVQRVGELLKAAKAY